LHLRIEVSNSSPVPAEVLANLKFVLDDIKARLSLLGQEVSCIE
jgi:hypothetical protein